MQVFNSGELNITYDDSGTGKAILFLHSFNQSRLMWEKQLTYFLEKGYRVVSMDIRGHGGSDFIRGQQTVEKFADDAIALLNHLGIERAYIVGASLGGYIGLRMWSKRKEVVAGLIISGSKARNDSPEIQERRRNQIKLIEEQGLEEFVKNTYRRLAKKTRDERPWVVEIMQLISLNMTAEAVAATLVSLIDKEDERPYLASINVPVLIMVGTEDVFTPRELSEEMHEGIPGSELVVFEDAGHFCSFDRPEDYSDSIYSFMKKNSW